ncbi:type II secretion system protein GspG [Kiritimatiellota bacterium B12222]|nr:type II secretion system protein GspG [Kiritimatiellota bacterium B12222]
MKNTTDKRREAFTLIEVMLVIMIIGVIAIIAINNLDIVGRSDKARRTATITLVGQLSTAVNSYYLDVGKMPTSLDALVNDPGVKNWSGPYVLKLKNDAWDEPFTYSLNGSKFEIISNAGGTEAGPVSSNDL